MPETPPPPAQRAEPTPPPPLVVAASLVAVQGLVMLLIAILEVASISADRVALGLSTALFFAAYGLVLLLGAAALWRRRAWARGPILFTQLFSLGLAWTLRDQPVPAVALALVAVVALVGMVHRDTMEALESGRDPDEQTGR